MTGHARCETTTLDETVRGEVRRAGEHSVTECTTHRSLAVRSLSAVCVVCCRVVCSSVVADWTAVADIYTHNVNFPSPEPSDTVRASERPHLPSVKLRNASMKKAE